MPRIRTIKPGYFTSPETARMSHAGRLLWVAMWCLADDYGVGELNLLQLRAFAFPEEDEWLDSELQKKGEGSSEAEGRKFLHLAKEVFSTQNVVAYINNGRHFYQVLSWDKHQKTQRKTKQNTPDHDHPDSIPDLRFHGDSELPLKDSELPSPSEGDSSPGKGKGMSEEGIDKKTYVVVANDEPEPKKKRFVYPDDFEKFWQAYPKAGRQGKRKALLEWERATRRAEPDEIIHGAHRYAADPNRSDAFTKHAQGWLSADRWEDGALPPRHDNRPPRTDLDDFLERGHTGYIDAEVIEQHAIEQYAIEEPPF